MVVSRKSKTIKHSSKSKSVRKSKHVMKGGSHSAQISKKTESDIMMLMMMLMAKKAKEGTKTNNLNHTVNSESSFEKVADVLSDTLKQLKPEDIESYKKLTHIVAEASKKLTPEQIASFRDLNITGSDSLVAEAEKKAMMEETNRREKAAAEAEKKALHAEYNRQANERERRRQRVLKGEDWSNSPKAKETSWGSRRGYESNNQSRYNYNNNNNNVRPLSYSERRQ
jgi:hypothetical protein